MGIKDFVCHVSQVCIETCRNVGRTVGTLPTCFKSNQALSVDPCTQEEIIEEVIMEEEIKKEEIIEGVIMEEEIMEEDAPAKLIADDNASSSQALTPRRQRLELLRSQCSNEFEYNIRKSTEHWTEVPRKSTVDPILLSANSKRFKRLMKRWRCPRSKYGFFLDYEERLKMGPKIAEGGQAEIFDANFKGDQREFVLKVFKDARLEDLERLWPPPLLRLLYVDYEPDWMKLERHCCWVRGGTVLKNGRFAFLMDKYDNDLRSFIDQRMRYESSEQGPFQLQDALRIMLDIAKGMRSLHKRGILHRDLKASNVLYQIRNEEFECVIADFETSMGVLGTGFWRAPEVLLAVKTHTLGPEIWTEKVDVYSYAMTCYEIITGHIPFEDLIQNDYDFVLNGGRPPVPHWYRYHFVVDELDLDEVYWYPNPLNKWRYPVPWLDDLLERCWDPDPLKRPSFKAIVQTFLISIPISKSRYRETSVYETESIFDAWPWKIFHPLKWKK